MLAVTEAEASVSSPPHGQVVDGDLSEVLFVVDDEESPEGYPGLLVEHAVVPGDAVRLVADDGDVHGSQTALLPGRVDPRQVSEVRVRGGGDHLTSQLAEIVRALRESDDLGRAHERADKQRHIYIYTHLSSTS